MKYNPSNIYYPGTTVEPRQNDILRSKETGEEIKLGDVRNLADASSPCGILTTHDFVRRGEPAPLECRDDGYYTLLWGGAIESENGQVISQLDVGSETARRMPLYDEGLFLKNISIGTGNPGDQGPEAIGEALKIFEPYREQAIRSLLDMHWPPHSDEKWVEV